MLLDGIRERHSWSHVAFGQMMKSAARTQMTPAAIMKKLRAARKETSCRGVTEPASTTASAAKASMRACEPRMLGPSVLVSSSTADDMRSWNSGWRSSSRRATPAIVNVLPSGCTSMTKATRPVAPIADSSIR